MRAPRRSDGRRGRCGRRRTGPPLQPPWRRRRWSSTTAPSRNGDRRSSWARRSDRRCVRVAPHALSRASLLAHLATPLSLPPPPPQLAAELSAARDELFRLRGAHDGALSRLAQQGRLLAHAAAAGVDSRRGAAADAAAEQAAAGAPATLLPASLLCARLETVLFELHDVAAASAAAHGERWEETLAAGASACDDDVSPGEVVARAALARARNALVELDSTRRRASQGCDPGVAATQEDETDVMRALMELKALCLQVILAAAAAKAKQPAPTRADPPAVAAGRPSHSRGAQPVALSWGWRSWHQAHQGGGPEQTCEDAVQVAPAVAPSRRPSLARSCASPSGSQPAVSPTPEPAASPAASPRPSRRSSTAAAAAAAARRSRPRVSSSSSSSWTSARQPSRSASPQPRASATTFQREEDEEEEEELRAAPLSLARSPATYFPNDRAAATMRRAAATLRRASSAQGYGRPSTPVHALPASGSANASPYASSVARSQAARASPAARRLLARGVGSAAALRHAPPPALPARPPPPPSRPHSAVADSRPPWRVSGCTELPRAGRSGLRARSPAPRWQ